MSTSEAQQVEGEGAEEDFAEAAADADEVADELEPTAEEESYDTEDEDPVEVICPPLLIARLMSYKTLGPPRSL